MNLRRYRLVKWDDRTGRDVPVEAPEPLRRYWTRGGAIVDQGRLEAAMWRAGLPWRFRVVKVDRWAR